MDRLIYKGKRHLPLPKGPYTVGCTDVMTGYSEAGCFIRLHYPCTDNGILEHHEKWPHWATKDYVDAFVSISEIPSILAGIVAKRTFGDLYIPAIKDSAPFNRGTPYPLIIFSHGLTACRTTYSANLVELASHGYIVAAVEHRDQSACYTYYMKKAKSQDNPSEITKEEDESVEVITEKQSIPILTKSVSSEFFQLRNKQVHQRAEECIRALDMLRDVNDGKPPKNVIKTNCKLMKFRGLFDMSKVALAGHSFGGASALLALSKDSRFKVGLALDPWIMPIGKEDYLPSRLTQPILIISSYGFYNNQNLEYLERIRQQKIETKYVTIRDTTHMSQCDVPFIVKNDILFRIVRWGKKHNYNDKFIHLDIHNRLMMLFLAKHLSVPIDAGFESYISSNGFRIMDEIHLCTPTPRHRRPWVYYTIAVLPILFVALYWRRSV